MTANKFRGFFRDREKPAVRASPGSAGRVWWNRGLQAVLLLRVATALPMLVLPAAALELHVAPSGHDGNPGTAARPVLTLHHAQGVARSQAGRESVTVQLHGGVYELRAPLVFGARDSGTAEHPVTWAAAADAEVVLSGGRKLDLGWQP